MRYECAFRDLPNGAAFMLPYDGDWLGPVLKNSDTAFFIPIDEIEETLPPGTRVLRVTKNDLNSQNAVV